MVKLITLKKLRMHFLS